jgi:hypothetical protein
VTREDLKVARRKLKVAEKLETRAWMNHKNAHAVFIKSLDEWVLAARAVRHFRLVLETRLESAEERKGERT